MKVKSDDIILKNQIKSTGEHSIEINPYEGIKEEIPTFQENEHLIDHFDVVMKKIDFYDQENPKQVKTRMRRLVKRLRPDKLETGILRGFLAKIEQILNKKN